MGQDIDRRSLLKMLAAAGATAVAGGFSRRAFADPNTMGGWNRRRSDFTMTREYKVLELYLYGGLSPWETFYVRNRTNWASKTAFATDFSALTWDCLDVTDSNLVSSSRYFADDESGNAVYLGPATAPLWRGTSPLADRLRLVVARHDLLPHEAAVPYAMTGLRLGSPRFSGLGAPLSRRALSLAPMRATPASYTIIPDPFVAADNLVAMTSVGQHPAENRPLQLKIGSTSGALTQRLQRSGLGTQRDDVLRAYQTIYEEQMSWPGRGRLRSKHYESYAASIRQVFNAPNLNATLNPSLFNITADPSCVYRGSAPSPDNRGKTSLGLAAHLLKNDDAKYVGVVDNGRMQVGGAGYDVHSNLALVTSLNLYSILNELELLIDTNEIDLDDTLIVINTEFGRTPNVGLSSGGRDHYPLGYTVGFLGGPIRGRGIAGAMTNADLPEASGSPFHPTDVMGAAILAAGVDPVHHEVFAVGDFSSRLSTAGESGARVGLARHLLGLSV